MSELTHGYFILWFIIQLHHNLFSFLELFSLASVFFQQALFFFKFLLYSVISQGASNFPCIFPVLASELTSSPRSPVPSVGEWCLETKSWHLHYVSSLPLVCRGSGVLQTKPGNTCTNTNAHQHDHLLIPTQHLRAHFSLLHFSISSFFLTAVGHWLVLSLLYLCIRSLLAHT